MTSAADTDMSPTLTQCRIASASNIDAAARYEQSARQLSSVIVAEEFLGDAPEQHKVTYVEVPIVKEVTKFVPKVEYVDVERIVPKYELEEMEEIVEVPQIEYIDRHVEKVITHEPGTKIVEQVTKEVLKHVPKVEYVTSKKVVEIPGEEIEVPIIKRSVTADDKNKIDTEVPVVVAQTIRPVLTEVFDDTEKVDVYQYNPAPQMVDVFVPKPVQAHLVVVGAVDEEHRAVKIPTAHYNTILKQVNQHLPEEDMAYLPYQVDPEYNKVTFLHASHTPGIVHYPEMGLAAVEQAQNQLTQCQFSPEQKNGMVPNSARLSSTTEMMSHADMASKHRLLTVSSKQGLPNDMPTPYSPGPQNAEHFNSPGMDPYAAGQRRQRTDYSNYKGVA